jgi:hypothetical protein
VLEYFESEMPCLIIGKNRDGYQQELQRLDECRTTEKRERQREVAVHTFETDRPSENNVESGRDEAKRQGTRQRGGGAP